MLGGGGGGYYHIIKYFQPAENRKLHTDMIRVYSIFVIVLFFYPVMTNDTEQAFFMYTSFTLLFVVCLYLISFFRQIITMRIKKGFSPVSCFAWDLPCFTISVIEQFGLDGHILFFFL